MQNKRKRKKKKEKRKDEKDNKTQDNIYLRFRAARSRS